MKNGQLLALLTTASLVLLKIDCTIAQVYPVPRAENKDFWQAHGLGEIQKAITTSTTQNWGVAKNVVLFVGDGLGITPSVAARIYKGQSRYGNSGEEEYLSWEKFPHAGLLKVYNTDTQVPDSGSTATAFTCGVKANYRTIGLDSSVSQDDCIGSLDSKAWLDSVMKWAQDDGKDTGFATTTTVTHATPAALYAHSANRDWECNALMGLKGHGCKDTGRQLLEDTTGRNAKVILGGGRLPMGATVGIQLEDICTRTDGRNLTNEWVRNKEAHGNHVSYVQNAAELLSVNIDKTDYLMGLFSDGHMQYEIDRETAPHGEPTLANMTSVAIKILSKNKHRGFFLMVEGGRIDHALHATKSARAFEEVMAFDEAIETALSMLDLKETLVIVTADHSHVMTINGYPTRGNNILGVGSKSQVDNIPFTTLQYTNGIAYNHYWNGTNVTRPDASKQNTADKDYQPTVSIPMYSETHSGEDVQVYAKGPMAHLFHTLHEQTHVANVMGYAACIGPYRTNCNRSRNYKVQGQHWNDARNSILNYSLP